MTQPLDPATKKTVLRQFTYGLYAVGVARGEERNMFTANWLTQVSFEPPLLALSVENDSHSISMILETGVFAVSVLALGERELAGRLGKRWELRPDKLDNIPLREGTTGCPVLQDALGYVECQVTAEVVTGDSTVFIAQVIHAEALREGQALTMAEAGFRHAG